MPYVSRRADLLERSLQDPSSVDPAIRDLVRTAGRIPALTSRASAPRDEFVSALGLRLRAEALTLPAPQVRGASATSSRPYARRPVVFVVGRRLPRILAGAAASLLVVGAVVGGASRSALPGGLLYPVRALLDQAAVQLAGSDFDRGVTLLSQAQEHISDVGALVERDGALADPEPVNQALLSAYDAVSEGQRLLLGEFDRTGNTAALIAVQDFAVRSLPQLTALRPTVPAESRAGVDALIALLEETRTTLARKIAVCGPPCASLAGLGVASPAPSAAVTGLTSSLTGDITTPGLLSVGGIPAPVLTTSVIGPDAVVVAPPLPITGSTADATRLPGTVGSITVSPPPIVIPTLQPLPILTSATSVAPLATGLPGLP